MDYSKFDTLSWRWTCRLCIAEKSSQDLQLLRNVKISYCSTPILDVLPRLGIKLVKSKLLPKTVCADCIQKVEAFYKFHENCFLNEELLKKKLLNFLTSDENAEKELERVQAEEVFKGYKKSLLPSMGSKQSVLNSTLQSANASVSSQRYPLSTTHIAKRKEKKRSLSESSCHSELSEEISISSDRLPEIRLDLLPKSTISSNLTKITNFDSDDELQLSASLKKKLPVTPTKRRYEYLEDEKKSKPVCYAAPFNTATSDLLIKVTSDHANSESTKGGKSEGVETQGLLRSLERESRSRKRLSHEPELKLLIKPRSKSSTNLKVLSINPQKSIILPQYSLDYQSNAQDMPENASNIKQTVSPLKLLIRTNAQASGGLKQISVDPTKSLILSKFSSEQLPVPQISPTLVETKDPLKLSPLKLIEPTSIESGALEENLSYHITTESTQKGLAFPKESNLNFSNLDVDSYAKISQGTNQSDSSFSQKLSDVEMDSSLQFLNLSSESLKTSHNLSDLEVDSSLSFLNVSSEKRISPANQRPCLEDNQIPSEETFESNPPVSASVNIDNSKGNGSTSLGNKENCIDNSCNTEHQATTDEFINSVDEGKPTAKPNLDEESYMKNEVQSAKTQINFVEAKFQPDSNFRESLPLQEIGQPKNNAVGQSNNERIQECSLTFSENFHKCSSQKYLSGEFTKLTETQNLKTEKCSSAELVQQREQTRILETNSIGNNYPNNGATVKVLHMVSLGPQTGEGEIIFDSNQDDMLEMEVISHEEIVGEVVVDQTEEIVFEESGLPTRVGKNNHRTNQSDLDTVTCKILYPEDKLQELIEYKKKLETLRKFNEFKRSLEREKKRLEKCSNVRSKFSPKITQDKKLIEEVLELGLDCSSVLSNSLGISPKLFEVNVSKKNESNERKECSENQLAVQTLQSELENFKINSEPDPESLQLKRSPQVTNFDKVEMSHSLELKTKTDSSFEQDNLNKSPEKQYENQSELFQRLEEPFECNNVKCCEKATPYVENVETNSSARQEKSTQNLSFKLVAEEAIKENVLEVKACTVQTRKSPRKLSPCNEPLLVKFSPKRKRSNPEASVPFSETDPPKKRGRKKLYQPGVKVQSQAILRMILPKHQEKFKKPTKVSDFDEFFRGELKRVDDVKSDEIDCIKSDVENKIDTGGTDSYVHSSNIEKTGMFTLSIGEKEENCKLLKGKDISLDQTMSEKSNKEEGHIEDQLSNSETDNSITCSEKLVDTEIGSGKLETIKKIDNLDGEKPETSNKSCLTDNKVCTEYFETGKPTLEQMESLPKELDQVSALIGELEETIANLKSAETKGKPLFYENWALEKEPPEKKETISIEKSRNESEAKSERGVSNTAVSQSEAAFSENNFGLSSNNLQTLESLGKIDKALNEISNENSKCSYEGDISDENLTELKTAVNSHEESEKTHLNDIDNADKSESFDNKSKISEKAKRSRSKSTESNTDEEICLKVKNNHEETQELPSNEVKKLLGEKQEIENVFTADLYKKLGQESNNTSPTKSRNKNLSTSPEINTHTVIKTCKQITALKVSEKVLKENEVSGIIKRRLSREISSLRRDNAKKFEETGNFSILEQCEEASSALETSMPNLRNRNKKSETIPTDKTEAKNTNQNASISKITYDDKILRKRMRIQEKKIEMFYETEKAPCDNNIIDSNKICPNSNKIFNTNSSVNLSKNREQETSVKNKNSSVKFKNRKVKAVKTFKNTANDSIDCAKLSGASIPEFSEQPISSTSLEIENQNVTTREPKEKMRCCTKNATLKTRSASKKTAKTEREHYLEESVSTANDVDKSLTEISHKNEDSCVSKEFETLKNTQSNIEMKIKEASQKCNMNPEENMCCIENTISKNKPAVFKSAAEKSLQKHKVLQKKSVESIETKTMPAIESPLIERSDIDGSGKLFFSKHPKTFYNKVIKLGRKDNEVKLRSYRKKSPKLKFNFNKLRKFNKGKTKNKTSSKTKEVQTKMPRKQNKKLVLRPEILAVETGEKDVKLETGVEESLEDKTWDNPSEKLLVDKSKNNYETETFSSKVIEATISAQTEQFNNVLNVTSSSLLQDASKAEETLKTTSDKHSTSSSSVLDQVFSEFERKIHAQRPESVYFSDPGSPIEFIQNHKIHVEDTSRRKRLREKPAQTNKKLERARRSKQTKNAAHTPKPGVDIVQIASDGENSVVEHSKCEQVPPIESVSIEAFEQFEQIANKGIEIIVPGIELSQNPPGETCSETSDPLGHIAIKDEVILPYYCLLCGEKFETFSQLHIHKQLHYTCAVCNVRFADEYKFKSHARTHQKPLYRCRICNRRFNVLSDLKRHVTKHKDPKITNCENIYDYIKDWTYEPDFYCNDCNFEYLSASALLQHMKTDHKRNKQGANLAENVEPYYIDDDDIIDVETCDDSDADVLKKEPVGENLVLSSFSKSDESTEHIDVEEVEDVREQEVHPNLEVTDVNCELFYCKQCNRYFATEYLLHKHLKDFHIANFVCEIKLERIEVHSKKKAKKSISCVICNRVFTYRTSMLKHIERKHGSSVMPRRLTLANEEELDIASRTCKKCGKICPSKTSLESHIETHQQNVNTLKCNQCESVFYTEGALRLHQRKHLIEKHLKCHHCDKVFSHKNNLDLHMKTHNKEPILQCQYCAETFVDCEQRENHEKAHAEAAEPYTCDTCQKGFREYLGYREHMSDVHGKSTTLNSELLQEKSEQEIFNIEQVTDDRFLIDLQHHRNGFLF